MEESVRELKEDLKNARNLIACLSETIERLSKTEKQGKDEGLHTKMDKILEKLEKQDELKGDFDILKHKVDKLTDSVKNIAHEVTNSAKIGRILDTVETSVGYSELFVKDFEAIHLKLLESEVTMNRFEKKQDHVDENSQNLNILIENMSISDAKLQEKAEQISLRLTEILQKTEINDLALKENSADKDGIMEIRDFAEETKKSVANITSYFGITSEPMLTCCNLDCNNILPNDLPLNKDGVSVECPNCNDDNIVGTLREGHKWMYIAECCDYNQYPLSREEGKNEKCRTCGKEGKLLDEFEDIAVRNDFKNVLRKLHNKMRRIETSVTLLSDPPLACWNCGCILPKNLPITEDGVSVKCVECNTNESVIVGKLKQNHKWMVAFCDVVSRFHFQQCLENILHESTGECQVCGKACILEDAQHRVAKSANDTS